MKEKTNEDHGYIRPLVAAMSIIVLCTSTLTVEVVSTSGPSPRPSALPMSVLAAILAGVLCSAAMRSKRLASFGWVLPPLTATAVFWALSARAPKGSAVCEALLLAGLVAAWATVMSVVDAVAVTGWVDRPLAALTDRTFRWSVARDAGRLAALTVDGLDGDPNAWPEGAKAVLRDEADADPSKAVSFAASLAVVGAVWAWGPLDDAPVPLLLSVSALASVVMRVYRLIGVRRHVRAGVCAKRLRDDEGRPVTQSVPASDPDRRSRRNAAGRRVGSSRRR